MKIKLGSLQLEGKLKNLEILKRNFILLLEVSFLYPYSTPKLPSVCLLQGLWTVKFCLSWRNPTLCISSLHAALLPAYIIGLQPNYNFSLGLFIRCSDAQCDFQCQHIVYKAVNQTGFMFISVCICVAEECVCTMH